MTPDVLTLADAWLHSLDSVLVSIGPIKIRWYGLSYVLGFMVGWYLLWLLAGRRATPIPRDRALDVIVWLVGGVLIGGRLGYAVFYKPSLFIGVTGDFPFWDLLALHKGGMSSHGGIIGVCVAAMRIRKGWKNEAGPDDQGQIHGDCPFLHVTDLIALIGTPGLVLGRLANFINGELLGKIVAGPGEAAPWWSVRYWQEAPERWEQLSEAQRSLIAESASVPSGPVRDGDEPFVNAAIGHVAALAEAARDGSASAAEELARLINARHPSQLYQALAEGVFTGLMVWWIARKPRVPGLVGAWFLIVYGVGRVLTELVRLPDSHLARATVLGLSRGQWLSVLMVATGTTVLWAVTRGPLRTGDRLLGWARKV